MLKQNGVDASTGGLPRPALDGFDTLAELALNMRWAWNHAADDVWRLLDPLLWDLTHNPWVILQTVAQDRLARLLADPGFRARIADLAQAMRQAHESPAWFQRAHPQSPLTAVAYFSMEFMLSEALPIYSGGLGNVAGDQLKAASDLGVPVVGVGLLYQQGYFRQLIDSAGAQQALFPYNDPGQMPIMPLRRANGEWLRVELALSGWPVWLRAWQVRVGRTTLYLLDSNDPANLPVHRGITGELYGGGPELRLRQELILGIGGWRLLQALGIRPEVCHLNEGHAAFVVLERALSFMKESGQPFETALAVTRAGNLFTTHTAVEAGFDRYDAGLIRRYLGHYAEQQPGIPFDDLLALGRQNPRDASEDFNMAYLALRGSGAVNGVSRLHGEVSRRLFAPLFPRWPLDEVPVAHVTNGIHTPSWDSAAADALWTAACGRERWRETPASLERDFRRVSDEQLWQFRAVARRALVEYARAQLARQRAAAGASPEMIDEAQHVFDPDALTLGFARRFASYKRPNLLLHDPERLLRLLTDPQRPAQLIVAGKAHPADRAGQDLIREWIDFIRRPGAQSHVIFLEDYDVLMAERLAHGVDVWINTPRRPWEACGTSGMKVLVNGGLNLSTLDGWWAEAYTPDVGWAVGDGREHGDDAAQDAADAAALYDTLEHDVIPGFYTRDANGIPAAWVKRIRESMARLTPLFSAGRAVREYTERYYIPAATAFRARAAQQGAAGARIVSARLDLERKWKTLRFGETQIVSSPQKRIFRVAVCLGELDCDSVRLELYADGVNNSPPERYEMKREPQSGEANRYFYCAETPATRPATDYTARAIPVFSDALVPLETGLIAWQR